ncbi:ABC transporter ATP-binding protein [Arsenicicoccus dermatophilus]|uniref:ABC transporter ATP-binding protein n=1 Tax=Arsenicicoccus dermatophilus TaxID=1076331 RepID=UPI003916EBAA
MTATRGTPGPADLLDPALAADSAATWLEAPAARATPDTPGGIDPRLVPPGRGGLGIRARAWRDRHRLRGDRARDFAATALGPQRGLPVADDAAVRRFVGDLLRQRRGWVLVVLATNAAAAVAGLLVPRLLGGLVDDTTRRLRDHATTEALDAATSTALVVGGVVLLQALLTYAAKLSSAVMGQGILAQAREHVVRAVLRLPLSRVEQAGTGDLVTRVTRDVGTMSDAVRWALPESMVSGLTVVLTLVAMVSNSWLLALPSLVLLALALVQVRRYLRQAPAAYLTASGTYAQINTTLTETVEGARTVEALGLAEVRRAHGWRDLAESGQAERYTMSLRNLLFLVMDLAFSLPRALTLALGAYGCTRGWVTLGQITTALLYVEAVWGPFDRLVHTLDRVQVGMASTTRLLGIATVPPDREAGPDLPGGRDLVGRDLRYAYREGHDVLHGIDVTLRTGERLAVVGPSGSGKSTLGRLLSGIHGPRTGSVTVGDVELTRLPLDVLRTEVALVTQEHHVFMGSVRDNVVLAREGATDDEVEAALRAVDAWEWVSALPDGLGARLGSGGATLTPGQAQQVALARLILADPHTLVLDEATSLIDPGTARHLEGSMNALLEGRTVVAIAHRLHTAHDADRIAVVIDGRVVELGSHDELMAQQGEYAALWRAWST